MLGKKLKPRKHLYGQAFALYAVSEFYLASGRKDVLDFAVRFFNLLEAKSHDKANAWKAGYHNGRSMIECLQILEQWKD